MADLTEAQKQAYWRYNIRLTIWSCSSSGSS